MAILVSIQYRSIESATAERLLLYVQNTLESASPIRADASRASSCASGEARLLLDKLNDTRTLYPDLSLSKLIEVQAQGAPDAIAVTCGERQLTYAELNASADRVAGYLRAHGVPRAPRSHLPAAFGRMAAVRPAVVKAGAAFLVLTRRIRGRHAEESPPRASRRSSAAITVAGGKRSRRPLDRDRGCARRRRERFRRTGECGAGCRKRRVLPHHPGNSRGAAVVGLSHRGIANVVYSLAKRPGIGSRDVVVSASPPATDRAVIELFAPLLLGARVVVAGERELGNGRSLLTLLQKSGATLMYGAAHTWRALLEAGWVGYRR